MSEMGRFLACVTLHDFLGQSRAFHAQAEGSVALAVLDQPSVHLIRDSFSYGQFLSQ